MTIKRVIIFHGYLAAPSRHWFEWVRTELAPDGVEVEVPELPDSDAPRFEQWVTTAVGAIGAPDQQTVVVGHSLGSVTALHALDNIDQPWKLGGLVLVSGFDEPLPTLPALDRFTARKPDHARTVSRTANRMVIVSDNDTQVPPEATHRLAAALDTEAIVVPGGGHFLGDEGFTQLPVLVERIRQI